MICWSGDEKYMIKVSNAGREKKTNKCHKDVVLNMLKDIIETSESVTFKYWWSGNIREEYCAYSRNQESRENYYNK